MSISGPGDLRDKSFFCPSVITREPASGAPAQRQFSEKYLFGRRFEI